MTWVATAVGGSSLVGGMMGGQASQNAAALQANSAANAQQISQNEFNTITAQQQPFMQGGYGALNEMNYLLGIGNTNWNAPPQSSYLNTSDGVPNKLSISGQGAGMMNGDSADRLLDPANSFGAGGLDSKSANAFLDPLNFGQRGAGKISGGAYIGDQHLSPSNTGNFTPSPTAGGFGSLLQPFNMDTWKSLSPAYNFQQQQGMQGVLNGDAAGSGALSGAAQKDLIGYNQNLANTSFANAFNMYQTQQGNIYDRLAGLMQLGQASASNTGQQGTALAGQSAQSAQNIGSALAAGQIGTANAYSGALSNASYMPWLMRGQGSGAQNGAEAGSGGNANNYYGGG